MKPSDRIKELCYQITGGGIGSPDVTLWSILKYLDEEFEKNKPCKHKNWQLNSINSSSPMKECKDCGILFY